MSTFPKISVIVPSYNQGEFLERTLKSILDQGYPNLELIVIDGGSSDNSTTIIQKYSSQIAYWVSESDGGQTYGLIKGFSRSSGDIQCWINSDDLMAPGCLSEVSEFFTHNPSAAAVFGDATWIDRDGKTLRVQREIGFIKFIWLNTYNYIPGMSMYWKRSLYEKVGGLNPSFNLAMDTDLWARFSDLERIFHVRSNWSYMRFYPEQKNRSLRANSNFEDERIRERYIGKSATPTRAIMRAAALALRIILKLFSGCYSIGYKRYITDKSK